MRQIASKDRGGRIGTHQTDIDKRTGAIDALGLTNGVGNGTPHNPEPIQKGRSP